MSKELRNLTSSYLSDGKRGIERPSLHKIAANAITPRMKTLFLRGAAADVLSATEARRLVPIHSSPNIYLVPHFLSARDLDHLDDLITSRRAAFKHSHTDSKDSQYRGLERTSISMALPKAADATLRAIEARAAELVGLPADHVEPLQIVHYTEGAKFDMHHDVAPIKLSTDVDDEDNDVAREEAATGCVPPNLTPDDVTVEKQAGPRRLVTLFVYLNTLPDGIGHTEFPLLRNASGERLSVRPRSGTALVFCNVDGDGQPDPLLCHRACPVAEKHRKFGVNIWISDVSQQMHAVASTSSKKASGAAKGGKGLLAPLLYVEPEDTPPPPVAALLGLQFKKSFGSHGVFVGTVASYSPSLGYLVEYEDGDEEDMDVDTLLKLPLADPSALAGRRVVKHFPGHGRFEGTIVGFETGPTFSIEYDDGDKESELPPRDVLRLLLPPTKGKASKKRRRGSDS